jgi:hypothetical protein
MGDWLGDRVVETREQTEALQCIRDGDIEQAIRRRIQLGRQAQDLIGPWMNVNQPDCGLPVEAAHVAVWLVKAHQTVDHRHRLERPVDGRVKVVSRGPARRDLDEGAE